MFQRTFLATLLLFFCLGLYAQVTPLPNAHAHNDYEHPRPLLDALLNGFTSVEADVHLMDGELYVAHDRPSKKDPSKTLRKVYLEPLKALIQKNGGRVYPGYQGAFYLMIDFKTQADSTYQVLAAQLKEYSSLLASNIDSPEDRQKPVRLFLSGNSPTKMILESKSPKLDYAGLDGRPEHLGKGIPTSLMPVVSESYYKIVPMKEQSLLTDKDLQKLQDFVKNAHAEGKKVRLWAAPDGPMGWEFLIRNGVDLVNTDKLPELKQFLHSKNYTFKNLHGELSTANAPLPDQGANLIQSDEPALIKDRVSKIGQGNLKTQNVILITFDGLRWQELFGGADSLLLFNDTFTKPSDENKALVQQFWKSTAKERREVLMPFFWHTIAQKGQLYGNRWKGNKVNVTNTRWFSYPGYQEILAGFADDENISSNDKFNNPNRTVLEYIHQQPGFAGKVAAFCSWDVFPYIINTERSKIPVSAGYEKPGAGPLTEKEKLIYELQGQIPQEWPTVRYDAFTHHLAKEYLEQHKPRALFLSYGETDDFAHEGVYDKYIRSTHQTDAFIADIWNYAQSDPFYKDKTTLLITTDHGRGTLPLGNWQHHGSSIPDSHEIWVAALGPDTPALGEVSSHAQLYQNQVAKTIAALLGLDYSNTKPVGEVIKSVMGKE